jgi:chromosome segregation ATPase
LDDLVAEQGEETSSGQALSEENQAKLKEILSFLHKDTRDQVNNADLLRDLLESFDQDLPADIKISLDPVSRLDDHFIAVKQALKNQSAQPALEQRRTLAKQSVKDLHSRTQSNKELLAGLQAALKSKETRKAELEAELKNLSAEIEADKKKIAEIPGLTEKLRKEASAALNEEKQLKAKLSALAKTQEADKQLLENISNMILNAKNVISKYLGV